MAKQKSAFEVIDGGMPDDQPNSFPASELRFGNGNGGDGTEMEKDYIDAKIEAVSARNDASFASLRADISNISTKLDQKPGIVWLIGVAITGFLGIVALLSYGGDRFDGGVQVQSAVSEISAENRRISQENTKNIGTLIKAIDELRGQIAQAEKETPVQR